MLEIIAVTTAICSCVSGVAAVAAIIITVGRKAKAPGVEQDRRLTVLEAEVKELRAGIKASTEDTNQKFERDMRRLAHIESGLDIIQRSLLTIMRHDISGNDINALTEMRDELDQYLTKPRD